ncbi:MAG: MBOAT family protein, partial [Hyphomicrobiaceae bacterium]
MVFPTLSFLLFYLVVWPASWLLVVLRQHLLHKLAIIAASYVFYAFWNWRLAGLLLASVLLNWAIGRIIGWLSPGLLRKAALALGVACNLALLGFFKYYGWFSSELNTLLTALGVGRELPLLEIILPIGISFFT